jgi:hypothetical protein
MVVMMMMMMDGLNGFRIKGMTGSELMMRSLGERSGSLKVGGGRNRA